MMITEEMYEIPIFMDNDLASYEHHSFARGYHAYMEIWSPLIGETLSCKRETSNVVDKDAIAIMRPDSYGKEVIVGHMPENVSKCCSMFLTLPNTTIEAEVVGKRLNRGGGYGLEIPVFYRFYGKEKTIMWLTKKLKAINDELQCKISKCLK